MTMQQTNPKQQVVGILEELLADFSLSRASELARTGSYANAERILQALLTGAAPSLGAFDLKARIYAQQGQLNEAAIWWQKVLDRDPGNTHAQSALARLRKMQRSALWVRAVVPSLIGVLALFVLVLAGYWGSVRTSDAIANAKEEFAKALSQSEKTQKVIDSVRAENKVLNREILNLTASLHESRRVLAGLRSSVGSIGKKQYATDTAMTRRLSDIQRELLELKPGR